MTPQRFPYNVIIETMMLQEAQMNLKFDVC